MAQPDISDRKTLTLILTLRHTHQGLSLQFHFVHHSENESFHSLAQMKEKEKMEGNVSASKREGKDIKRLSARGSSDTTSAPGLSQTRGLPCCPHSSPPVAGVELPL